MAEPADPRAVVVHVPRSLAALFPGVGRRVLVGSGTVLDVVTAVDQLVPGFANRVFDAGPAIRDHLNVFVAGEPATLHTVVPDGAEVYIVPAVSGG